MLTESGTAVRLCNAAHRFPGTGDLFTGLDADLVPGEVVGLVGPSGSGKSTLLSLIAGWEDPTDGTISRVGVEHVGWVFQNPHGVARRTVLDHVVLPLIAQGTRRRRAEKTARTILARFDLDHAADRQFRALSGGEGQRLMRARAVATAPDLLLVDEPTAQLDLATAATVNDVLAGNAQESTIVVAASTWGSPDPGWEVWSVGGRVVALGMIGAMVGTVVAGATTREQHLFRYFKER